MRIGVLSDTHRDRQCIARSVEYIRALSLDCLVHLGDNVEDGQLYKKYFANIPVRCVTGNNDYGYVNVPAQDVLEAEGHKILLTHGHHLGVQRGRLGLIYRAKELACDTVLFGHTHVQEIVLEDGVLLVNPGSLSMPRKGCAGLALLHVEIQQIRPLLLPLV